MHISTEILVNKTLLERELEKLTLSLRHLLDNLAEEAVFQRDLSDSPSPCQHMRAHFFEEIAAQKQTLIEILQQLYPSFKSTTEKNSLFTHLLEAIDCEEITLSLLKEKIVHLEIQIEQKSRDLQPARCAMKEQTLPSCKKKVILQVLD